MPPGLLQKHQSPDMLPTLPSTPEGPLSPLCDNFYCSLLDI